MITGMVLLFLVVVLFFCGLYFILTMTDSTNTKISELTVKHAAMEDTYRSLYDDRERVVQRLEKSFSDYADLHGDYEDLVMWYNNVLSALDCSIESEDPQADALEAIKRLKNGN